ncbi:hypothetical protein ACLB2K_063797 [Fragaria x ananassa]
MVNSSEKGELNGIHLSPNGTGITQLFFADDSLFFLKADEIHRLRLKTILDDYCSASGQSINIEKSSIFFSPNRKLYSAPGAPCTRPSPPSILKKSKVRVKWTAEMDGIPPTLASTSAYLQFGEDQRLKLLASFGVACKVSCKAGNKTNSLAGKAILIKLVTFAIPTYPMSCFKLPVTLCREFDAMIANFWWGQKK